MASCISNLGVNSTGIQHRPAHDVGSSLDPEGVKLFPGYLEQQSRYELEARKWNFSRSPPEQMLQTSRSLALPTTSSGAASKYERGQFRAPVGERPGR